jgi:hypothetical protein
MPERSLSDAPQALPTTLSTGSVGEVMFVMDIGKLPFLFKVSV